MKNKKTVIIIISIISAYLVLAIVLFGFDNLKNKFRHNTIMFSTGDKWKFENGKWIDIKDNKKFEWENFDVYIDDKLIGNYDLLYNDKWYIYDKNSHLVKYDGRFLAISGNKNYKVIEFEEKNLNSSDENYIKAILRNKNIEYPDEFNYAKKVELDVDNDNKLETIYTVSNAFVIDNSSKKFSFVLIKDDEPQMLYEKYVEPDQKYKLCVPKMNSVIDFNKDSKYEIIIECNYYSDIGTSTNLYKQHKGKYELVKGGKKHEIKD